jgi:GTP-binding protein EngB required for normal cell division
MTGTEQNSPHSAEQRHSIAGALRDLLRISDSGTRNDSLHERLLSLERKLASNELHLAVLGQMKRGKSSFINALMGAEILPTGVLPVTAVITEIKYGLVPEAVILYSTGAREQVDPGTLADYITESGNPGNKKQVASVELAYPSPFLESGIILIDTPGIGSTHVHNTRTTEGYLQQVDAGIVVLSVDPPITEVESSFIRNVKEDVPKLFFILNKVDAASADDVAHIACFLEEELSRLQIASPEIFCLSARRAIEGRRKPPTTVASSGIEMFEERLRTFLLEEKDRVLVRSIAFDALHIARTLKFAATIGVRVQSMSLDELRLKGRAIEQLLEQTESEMNELRVLQREHSADIIARVERDLNMHVQESVPIVRQHLQLFPSQHPRETGRAFGALLESFLMDEIETVFRSWRIREDETVQSLLDTLSARFVNRANAILDRLQQAAGMLFEIPVEAVMIHCPLRVESHLYYRVERVFHSLDSFFLVLPRFLLRPIVLGKMQGRIWQFLDLNAGRIRYDYVERLQSSMSQFEKDLGAGVTMLTESLRSALRKPREGTQPEAAGLDVLECVSRDCARIVGLKLTSN